MYAWMRFHNFNLTQIPGTEFKRHAGNVSLWAPEDLEFMWSNNKRKEQPNLLAWYHTEVRDILQGADVITLRNNDESQVLLNTETRVSHNVHGLNHLQHHQNVSLESALNPHPELEQFFRQTWLSQMGVYEQKKQQDYIINWFSAYRFYQVVMRTKLRSRNYNSELIQVFVMNPKTMVLLSEYFLTPSANTWNMSQVFEAKKQGRPAKLTPEERKQKRREASRLSMKALRDKKANQ
jgi:alpha-galactosidase/6-phospho-beta-glucosidase family protein